MIYSFQGGAISHPLSAVHNTPQWETSLIGKLHHLTGGAVFIREIPQRNQSANYAWRVVDAHFTDEDSTNTYFRAYGINGEHLPFASFGVNWSGVEATVPDQFVYNPEFGRHYYVPGDNRIHTPEAGGYTVQVLDLYYPSEGLSFGLYKQGKQHQALIVSFRAFVLGKGYPNDF